MLKPPRTRWIGYADPLSRLNEQYTSVVDHTAVTALSKQSNAEAKVACSKVLHALADLSSFIAVLAVLPYMRTMKTLILQLSSRDLHVGDLDRAVESAGSHLSARYADADTAWCLR
jgi:hypothetical protein